ncbi:MAG: hypothetical protein JWR23_2084 [Mucilaginibacter sp.]|nr:hypothetical protein [Mucilaginibacter sp.]
MNIRIDWLRYSVKPSDNADKSKNTRLRPLKILGIVSFGQLDPKLLINIRQIGFDVT